MILDRRDKTVFNDHAMSQIDYPLLRRINHYLMRWVRKKYRKVRTFKKFHRRWQQVTARFPLMFAQWKWVHSFW